MGIRLCETRRVMSMPCSMSSTSAIQVCRGGRGDLALQRRITMLYGHRCMRPAVYLPACHLVILPPCYRATFPHCQPAIEPPCQLANLPS